MARSAAHTHKNPQMPANRHHPQTERIYSPWHRALPRRLNRATLSVLPERTISMRLAKILTLAATLAATGIASAQTGTTTTSPATATPVAPAQPEKPMAVPVPTGPAVKTNEVEGILIEDIKIGEGYEIKPGGAVVAHYHGTLKADPSVTFDSSFERGEPVPFPLSGVIEGWQKGVPGMKIGGVRKLTIPARLAYGDRSPSAKIPANADLVFVIQIIDALQIEDVKVGEGEEATNNCVAVTAHTMKDKDGTVVDKVEAAAPYIWIPGEFDAIAFGVEGMKVGGKRKLIVPPQMNIVPMGLVSTRPQNVPLTIELDLIAVRNLPRRGR